MRQINQHIIHCSDSTFGDVKIVRLWHEARNFKDVGYHFIIRQDGEIEIGRPLEQVGAHCAGHNKHSIGTCLIGRDTFAPEQMAALKKLHKMLCGLFPDLRAVPHRQFNPHKTCPNFDVAKILGEK